MGRTDVADGRGRPRVSACAWVVTIVCAAVVYGQMDTRRLLRQQLQLITGRVYPHSICLTPWVTGRDPDAEAPVCEPASEVQYDAAAAADDARWWAERYTYKRSEARLAILIWDPAAAVDAGEPGGADERSASALAVLAYKAVMGRPDQPVPPALCDELKRLCIEGHQLEPDNAFWDVVDANRLVAIGELEAAEAALLRVTGKSAYDDHRVDIREAAYHTDRRMSGSRYQAVSIAAWTDEQLTGSGWRPFAALVGFVRMAAALEKEGRTEEAMRAYAPLLRLDEMRETSGRRDGTYLRRAYLTPRVLVERSRVLAGHANSGPEQTLVDQGPALRDFVASAAKAGRADLGAQATWMMALAERERTRPSSAGSGPGALGKHALAAAYAWRASLTMLLLLLWLGPLALALRLAVRKGKPYAAFMGVAAGLTMLGVVQAVVSVVAYSDRGVGPHLVQLLSARAWGAQASLPWASWLLMLVPSAAVGVWPAWVARSAAHDQALGLLTTLCAAVECLLALAAVAYLAGIMWQAAFQNAVTALLT